MIPSLDSGIFLSFLRDTLVPFWPVIGVVIGLWLGFRIFGLFFSVVSRPSAVRGDEDEEQEEDVD